MSFGHGVLCVVLEGRDAKEQPQHILLNAFELDIESYSMEYNGIYTADSISYQRASLFILLNVLSIQIIARLLLLLLI